MSLNPEFAAAFGELMAKVAAAHAANPPDPNVTPLEMMRAQTKQGNMMIQAIQSKDLPPGEYYAALPMIVHLIRFGLPQNLHIPWRTRMCQLKAERSMCA